MINKPLYARLAILAMLLLIAGHSFTDHLWKPVLYWTGATTLIVSLVLILIAKNRGHRPPSP